MKHLFTLMIIISAYPSISQKPGDSRLIVVIGDTTNVFQKVKYALVNSDFIVKDNGNKDTLDTYSREYDGLYCMARAIIKADTVTIFGAYGQSKINEWGYTQSPKSYKRIMYYPGGKGKGWKMLMRIANHLGETIYYEK